MRRAVLVAALAAGALLSSSGAHATVITWGFEGRAEGIGANFGPCNYGICAAIVGGVDMVGRISFELPDTYSPSSRSIDWVTSGDDQGIWVDIGPYHYESNELHIGALGDFSPNPGYRFIGGQSAGDFSQFVLCQDYVDRTGDMPFDNLFAALPKVPARGCTLDGNWVRPIDGSNDVEIRVTRWFAVPEPPVLPLFALGVLALAACRRNLNGSSKDHKETAC